jgi:hypothetical protein
MPSVEPPPNRRAPRRGGALRLLEALMGAGLGDGAPALARLRGSRHEIGEQARSANCVPVHTSRGRCGGRSRFGMVGPGGAVLRDGAHNPAHGVQQYGLLARRSVCARTRGSAGFLDRQRVAILSWGLVRGRAHSLRGLRRCRNLITGRTDAANPYLALFGQAECQVPKRPRGADAPVSAPSTSRMTGASRRPMPSSGRPGTGRSSRSWPSG